ncbi:MAG: hypothetical protein LBR07_09980, partial [Puniceicoccales bacterium]|nr:hypothetical protein [Puniceicoccales bacterium]
MQDQETSNAGVATIAPQDTTTNSAAPDATGATGAAFDVARWRADFPILARRLGKNPLTYLDNGASAQKPLAVIETLDRYYREQHA